MTKNQKNLTVDGVLIEGLSKDLDSLIQQVSTLIEDIQNNKVEFVKLRSELEHLIKNTENLSNIIWGDDSDESLIVKIALIEKTLEELKTDLTKVEGEIHPKENTAAKNEEKSSRWKLYLTIIAGVITVTGSVLAILMQLKIL